MDSIGTHRKVQAFRLLGLAVALLLALAGCDSAAMIGDQQPAGQPVVVSDEAAMRFVEKVAAVGDAGANGQPVTLTVTDEEVSSFLDLASRVAQAANAEGVRTLSDLAAMDPSRLPPSARDLPGLLRELQAQGNLPDLELPDLSFWSRISQPRVNFTDSGQIVFTGVFDILGFGQHVRLVTIPQAVNGKLHLAFVEGQVGLFPIPRGLADQILKDVDYALLLGQDYASISDIQVSNGQLSVTGRLAGSSSLLPVARVPQTALLAPIWP